MADIRPFDDDMIAFACDLLKGGEPIAFASETVYGLGADAHQDKAVATIYDIKGRPQFNPLITHISDLDMADDYVEFSPLAKSIAHSFWPGALTIVLRKKQNISISKLVTAGLDTMAIRQPAHQGLRRLIENYGRGIAAPSANISGRLSPTSSAHVEKMLGDKIPLILSDDMQGMIKYTGGLESTIIAISDDGQLYILREGLISQEALKDKFPNIRIINPKKSPSITSPGQLARHYAPAYELRLNANAPYEDEAWLGFGAETDSILDLPQNKRRNLSLSADLVEAAANLFKYLHQFEQESRITKLAVAKIPHHGLGQAINDRLKRAMTKEE